MAIKRSGTAHWAGNGKVGKGTVSTESGVLSNTHYSYKTRFEEGIGTNPEELIAAAHAGCYSMKLAFVLQAANITPEFIDTKAFVNLDQGVITEVNLYTRVSVDGLDKESFAKYAQEAKENCPLSKSTNANITLDAEMV
ncbi:MAG: OsmC family protein [Saprospiraceae bacterium]